VEPETIILVVVFIALTLYALLGGADFGAGVWEVNSALNASHRQRAMLHATIGPVWEANHVWLILVLVAMFAAFPVAFAAACQALWLPLLLALLGIVFRGIGFAFRSYTRDAGHQQAAWDAVFAIGSTAAPFFLGASVGALASGKLAIDRDGRFDGDYLSGWISPLALFTGFFVVGMCAYLSAVYLAREASLLGDRAPVLLWRRRALATGVAVGMLALAGVVLVATGAPVLWEGFRLRSWPLVGGSMIAGFSSLYSLGVERYRTAVLSAAIAVSTVIWGWGIAQFPLIVPPAISIESAKAPANVLWLFIATICVGAVLLFPALGYLFYLFKSGRKIG
jgi:cytochrome d ubiquinol oxidase subunit II